MHTIDSTYLEGGKPHEPVQAVVVGWYDAGSPCDVARLTVELNLHPLHSIHAALHNDLSTHLCDTRQEKKMKQTLVNATA